jgi:hypothetical protein
MARQIKPSPVVIASYDIAMFRATTMVLELIPTTNTYILGTRMRRAPKKDRVDRTEDSLCTARVCQPVIIAPL